MNYFLAQIVLAGRNSDEGGWINILFLVVVGVVWALSSIAKVKKQQPQSRRKAEQSAQGRQLGTTSPLPRYKIDRFREKILDLSGIASDKYHRVVSLEIPKSSQSKLSRQQKDIQPTLAVLPETEPNVQKVPGLTSELNKKADVMPTNTEDLFFLYDLLDITEQENLKKAILYKEIFGKPLSLREITDI